MTTRKKPPTMAQLAKQKGTWAIQETPKERMWSCGLDPNLWATKREIETWLRSLPDAPKARKR